MTTNFPEPDIALAERLFGALEKTRVGKGFVRASYGEGEQFAHDLVRQTGTDLGMTSQVDCGGNLYVTLPGIDHSSQIVIGSHMDTVPQGGNFDGAAGVIAGLAVAAGFRKAGFVPKQDITVMATRAEEAAWFEGPYIGSRAALGLLPGAVLDNNRRPDTGRSLAEHMRELGFDPDGVRAGMAHLSKQNTAAYIEVHIEQGPVLENAGLPVGIVTAINGCLRYTECHCRGLYGHSGVQPRELRRDAVQAVIELGHRFYASWDEMIASGHELKLSMGLVNTNPKAATPSKVAGECSFSLDVRTASLDTMKTMEEKIAGWVRQIEREAGVTFALATPSYSYPAPMDGRAQESLARAAAALGIKTMRMPSGAGHDAAVFSEYGIPSAMIFIRNQHGSHNPDEAMDIADFAQASRLLAAHLTDVSWA